MRGKTHNEGFFATPEEHQAIELAAKQMSVTKSTLIRLVLFGNLPPIKLKEGDS